MNYKIIVINPGSTSTKIAYFENDHKILETSVFHDAPTLAKFETINDQLPYRMELINDFIDNNGIDLTDLDAVVGRGGGCGPCRTGVYEVTEKLLEDTVSARSGVQHPSNLGVQLAVEIQKKYGGRAFAVDIPMADEFEDVARISGMAGLYRYSHLHVLNLKATAREHCRRNSMNYDECNLIVCHIDGGMSVTAHRRGRMIDGNDAAGGEGPFTPTRPGGIDLLDFIDYLIECIDHGPVDPEKSDCNAENEEMTELINNINGCAGDGGISKTGEGTLNRKKLLQIRKTCTGSSGLSGYFGTSNADVIHEMVEHGDKKAELVWKAMIYQISKSIGSMAVTLKGKVDGIVCGGGLLRFSDVCDGIREQCGWIAPVSFYPGEFEHEAMASGALRVLRGEEAPGIYTGDQSDIFSEEFIDIFPDVIR